MEAATMAFASRKRLGWKATSLLSAATLFLAGCAAHTWMPGPDVRETFNEAKGQCMLLANNTGGGFYAQGTPSFVAGATLGAAIGQAIKAQSNFDACMMANGWEIADGATPPRPTTNMAPPSSSSANFPAVTPSYTGDRQNGKREGHGTAIYANGSKYVGEFKNDVRSGRGVWTDTTGNSYDGEWANDRRNGYGIETDVKSGVNRELWQNGILIQRDAVPPTPVAPVPVTAASANLDLEKSISPKSSLVPNPSNAAGPAKAPSKRSSPIIVSSGGTQTVATRPKAMSATAAALSANAPAKKLSPAPAAEAATTLLAKPSTLPVSPCTHAQQVEARIAQENGYTGGPKCN